MWDYSIQSKLVNIENVENVDNTDTKKLEVLVGGYSMGERMEFKCNLDSETIERFKQIAIMKGDNTDLILEDLIGSYISNSLKELLSKYEKDNNKVNNEAKSGYRKVVGKIRGWAKKPWQSNHKILKAFWQLKSESGTVIYEALEKRCSDNQLYPDTYVEKFKGNFDQMKTDKGNSHGKVFEIYEESKVKIWDKVYEDIIKHREYFI